MQKRPVEVVWHQDGCCNPISSARKVKNSRKLLFNKISDTKPETILQRISWKKDAMLKDDNKDRREI